MGLSYQQVRHSYSALANPEWQVPTNLAQLDQALAGRLTADYLLIDLAPLYNLRVLKTTLMVGPNIQARYLVSANQKIDARRGCIGPCLGKREPLSIQANLPDWQISPGLRIAYRIQSFNLYFDLRTDLSMRAAVAYRLF